MKHLSYSVPITNREDSREEFIKRLEKNLRDIDCEIELSNNYSQYQVYNVIIKTAAAVFYVLYPEKEINIKCGLMSDEVRYIQNLIEESF